MQARAAAATLVMVVALAGCSMLPGGVQQPCTLIGCSDGVFEQLSNERLRQGEPVRLEMCIDERCFVAQGPLRQAQPLMAIQGSDRLTVSFSPGELFLQADLDTTPYQDEAIRSFSLTLTVDGEVAVDESGTIQFTPSFPNGEQCPPPCWQGSIEYS